VIGRKGSMINLLTKETNTRITVGQNGVILVSGEKPETENLAVKALQMIDEEAHTPGLTDRISELLKEGSEPRLESNKE